MAKAAKKRSPHGSTRAPGIASSDRVLLDNDFGAVDRDVITDDEVRPPEIAARPRSEVTGRHDEGSGANETIDGLDEYQEATRHGAEDVPDKRTTLKDIPVFDRADVEPKV